MVIRVTGGGKKRGRPSRPCLGSFHLPRDPNRTVLQRAELPRPYPTLIGK